MAKEKPTTKLCKYCKTEIPYDAKVCPQCRKKQKGGFFKWVLIAALVLIGIIAFAGGGGSSSSSNTSSGQNAIQTINNVSSKSKLEEVTAPQAVSKGYGIMSIEGSMKNISGKTLSYAQITFALYDKDGAQVGTAVANINNLTKDSVWKYSATPLTMDEWASFELTEIDAWYLKKNRTSVIFGENQKRGSQAPLLPFQLGRVQRGEEIEIFPSLACFLFLSTFSLHEQRENGH